MKVFLRNSLLTVLFAALIGCGSGNKGTNGNSVSASPVEKGKVIPRVTCKKNNTVTYAFYLPKNYNTAHKFPVIIAFDPQANGILPIEKYKELADKYNYILMGSNESENGQDMNLSGVITDALISETSGRYSIDSTRVYVMGFSGGARIASMIGLYDGGIAGVIGCGAGFPSLNQPVQFKPDYISMAGTSDFNMNELISLDKQLDEAKFTHASILFNGRHAWPPTEVMENAFIWTEFCSMRKGLIPKNDSMISKYVKFQEVLIENDKHSGDALQEHNHLVNLLRFTDQLASTDEYKRSLTELENSSLYKNEQKQLQQMIGKELKEQQLLNDDFFSKDIGWWKKKIANYEVRISKGVDSSDVRMYKRLKSYLSLLCYMSYNRVLSSNDTVASKHAMDIYFIVDPENAAITKANKKK